MSNARDLFAMLQGCAAKVIAHDEFGTGAFIGGGYLITCSHVVRSVPVHEDVRIEWEGRPYDGKVVFKNPVDWSPENNFPDVAIIATNVRGHDSIVLSPVPVSHEAKLYGYGFPLPQPGDDEQIYSVPFRSTAVGDVELSPVRGDSTLLRITGDFVQPGLSGAPILDLDTGYVCGLLKRRLKSDPRDRYAVRAAVIAEQLAMVPAVAAVLAQPNVAWDEARRRLFRPSAKRVDTRPVYTRPVMPRPVVETLKPLLFGKNVAGVLPTAAVWGLPGVGKTMAAAAACYDPDVLAHFGDGILWVTLADRPGADGSRFDPAAVMRDWLSYFGEPRDVRDPTAALRNALRERNVLIVLDDVWNLANARPFFVGGSGCAVLVTARRRSVAIAAGGTAVKLSPPSPNESLRLVESFLGRELDVGERREARGFAKRVGFLPKALDLAAAQIRQGEQWSVLRIALDQEVARLEALETQFPEDGDQTLDAMIELSVQRARAQPDSLEISFGMLGICVEGAPIAAETAALLWSCPVATARDGLERLTNESIVEEAIVPATSRGRVYLMHAVVRDVARRMLTRPISSGGCGMPIADANAILLRNVTASCAGRWDLLPDDGYVREHLLTHATAAYGLAGLRDVLCKRGESGKLAWYEARCREGRVDRFIGDVEFAHAFAADAAKTEIETRDDAVADATRYALMRASVASLRFEEPPKVLYAVASRNLISMKDAVARADRMTDLLDRAAALLLLAKCTTDASEARALMLRAEFAARIAVERPDDRVVRLGEVVAALLDAGGTNDALDVLLSHEPDVRGAICARLNRRRLERFALRDLRRVMGPLEVSLPVQLELAIAVAERTLPVRAREHIALRFKDLGPARAAQLAAEFGARAGRALRDELTRLAMRAAFACDDLEQRATGFAKIADVVPVESFDVLLWFLRLAGLGSRLEAEVIAHVLPRMPRELRSAWIQHVSSRKFGDARSRLEALTLVMRGVASVDVCRDWLRALRAARPSDGITSIKTLAARLPWTVAFDALDALRELRPAGNDVKSAIVDALAPAIADAPIRYRLLALLLTIDDRDSRITTALRLLDCGLSKYYEIGLSKEFIADVNKFVEDVRRDIMVLPAPAARGRYLLRLLPHSQRSKDTAAWRSALELCEMDGPSETSLDALVQAVPQIPSTVQVDVVECVLRVDDLARRRVLAERLVPHLSVDGLRAYFVGAGRIRDDALVSQLLEAIPPGAIRRADPLAVAHEQIKAIGFFAAWDQGLPLTAALRTLGARARQLGSPAVYEEAMSFAEQARQYGRAASEQHVSSLVSRWAPPIAAEIRELIRIGTSVLEPAVAVARRIPEHDARAYGLLWLAAQCDAVLCTDLACEALDLVLAGKRDRFGKQMARFCCAHLGALDEPSARRVWLRCTARLAELDRPAALEILLTIWPLLCVLGDTALEGVRAAVRDVAEIWP